MKKSDYYVVCPDTGNRTPSTADDASDVPEENADVPRKTIKKKLLISFVWMALFTPISLLLLFGLSNLDQDQDHEKEIPNYYTLEQSYDILTGDNTTEAKMDVLKHEWNLAAKAHENYKKIDSAEGLDYVTYHLIARKFSDSGHSFRQARMSAKRERQADNFDDWSAAIAVIGFCIVTGFVCGFYDPATAKNKAAAQKPTTYTKRVCDGIAYFLLWLICIPACLFAILIAGVMLCVFAESALGLHPLNSTVGTVLLVIVAIPLGILGSGVLPCLFCRE